MMEYYTTVKKIKKKGKRKVSLRIPRGRFLREIKKNQDEEQCASVCVAKERVKNMSLNLIPICTKSLT